MPFASVAAVLIGNDQQQLGRLIGESMPLPRRMLLVPGR